MEGGGVTVTPEDVVRQALAARGCRCRPDIDWHLEHGVLQVTAAHDDGCPSIGGEVRS
jgi:hypothetical protein